MDMFLNWESPEWLELAQSWADQNLAKHGLEPLGKLQKVSGWALGQIFKQNTNKGLCFFKATAFLPLFSNESQLCAKLSELMPEYVPETMFISSEKQWMMSKDFGGGLPEDADKGLWPKAFQRLARLQQQSTKHTDALIKSGCLLRQVADIPEQLNSALNDTEITRHLTDDFIINKDEILLRVKQAVEKLASFNMPNTLVHGDLHIENIAQVNGTFIFFDWSDACISHPFIDGTYIYRMPEGENKQRIVTAYLSQWSDFGDPATLRDAWDTAELVCYAHQAISYASMKKALSSEQMVALEQAFLNAFNRLLAKS
ncbi:phosphotransferase [Pseudoalteromonas sp. BDTF-M6]|uniref:phosphotransferase n=1 Tax=Pseudoalteromonas sp. BDTF-M6 TaxID=2796132 RepID=UPI001BAEDD76|nr:phosphotransferase [Pseudoalteromonas sp. BDTF-M6]MBS3798175.1 phosphotransferase [Pseudoalteromonas sp. BDTF-M6]